MCPILDILVFPVKGQQLGLLIRGVNGLETLRSKMLSGICFPHSHRLPRPTLPHPGSSPGIGWRCGSIAMLLHLIIEADVNWKWSSLWIRRSYLSGLLCTCMSWNEVVVMVKRRSEKVPVDIWRWRKGNWGTKEWERTAVLMAVRKWMLEFHSAITTLFINML